MIHDQDLDELTMLLHRWQQGDRDARDQLFARVQSREMFFARRLLRGSFARIGQFEDTGDVLADAQMRMLQAFEKEVPHTLTDFFRLSAWHIRMSLLDRARHYFGPRGAGSQQEPLDPTGNVEEQLGQSTYDPARLAELTDLHELIQNLPPEIYQVVALHWYHGLTHAAVAKCLEIDIRTVERRWQKARQTLSHSFGLD